jgi:hypothetical protein
VKARPVLFGVGLVAIAVVAGIIAVQAVGIDRVAKADPTPADGFMQSLAARDGRTGWQQLCRSAQAELPLDEFIQRTEALRGLDSTLGISVTMDLVRSEPRPEGGERRTYLATARQFGAPLIQRTFVVRTQASGCVEGVD